MIIFVILGIIAFAAGFRFWRYLRVNARASDRYLAANSRLPDLDGMSVPDVQDMTSKERGAYARHGTVPSRFAGKR